MQGQLQCVDVKFPQPLTLSAPDIQPSTSHLDDPGSLEIDDPPSEES